MSLVLKMAFAGAVCFGFTDFLCFLSPGNHDNALLVISDVGGMLAVLAYHIEGRQ